MRSIRPHEILLIISIPVVILGIIFLIALITQSSNENPELEIIATYWDTLGNATTEYQLTQTNIAIENYNATQTAVPMTLTP